MRSAVSTKPKDVVRTRPVRPLRLCEPSTGEIRPAAAGQLTLPVRADPEAVWVEPQPRPPGPPRPSDDDLRAVLAALVEVADGRRRPDRLRAQLTGRLLSKLRARPGTPLGLRYSLRTLHVGEQPGSLEICATVDVVPGRRAFAIAARFESNWHGWVVTDFAVIAPPTSTHPRDLAA